MKHNTEKAVVLVQQALATLGDDFALSNARGYLKAALNEINHVQVKRKKRDYNFKRENAIKEEKKLKLSKEEALRRFQALEQMLKVEEAKLRNGPN